MLNLQMYRVLVQIQIAAGRRAKRTLVTGKLFVCRLVRPPSFHRRCGGRRRHGGYLYRLLFGGDRTGQGHQRWRGAARRRGRMIHRTRGQVHGVQDLRGEGHIAVGRRRVMVGIVVVLLLLLLVLMVVVADTTTVVQLLVAAVVVVVVGRAGGRGVATNGGML